MLDHAVLLMVKGESVSSLAFLSLVVIWLLRSVSVGCSSSSALCERASDHFSGDSGEFGELEVLPGGCCCGGAQSLSTIARTDSSQPLLLALSLAYCTTLYFLLNAMLRASLNFAAV